MSHTRKSSKSGCVGSTTPAPRHIGHETSQTSGAPPAIELPWMLTSLSPSQYGQVSVTCDAFLQDAGFCGVGCGVLAERVYPAGARVNVFCVTDLYDCANVLR